jgi:hypothetical protein
MNCRLDSGTRMDARIPDRSVDSAVDPCSTPRVRKSASIRLGLLLAVSALLVACDQEKPQERRCVDGDGQFVDEANCAGGVASGATAGATGGWDQPDGGSPAARGGYHFIWIPYGMFGGMGTYAPGYVRSGPGGPSRPGDSPGSVSRGGFGATGAAHAGSASVGT